MEADRQLDLADLLGTALSAGDGSTSDDPWQRTVVALADARCRRHKPSEVLLNRFGARAWGGIGLATALVFTLAALPGFPSGAGANAGGGQGARRVGERVNGGSPAFASGTQRPRRAMPESPGRGGEETVSPASADSPESGSGNDAASTAPDGRGHDSTGDADGAGGGAAKARRPGVLPGAVPPPQTASVDPSTLSGESAGGGGGASSGVSDKTNLTTPGGTAITSRTEVETPPWKSDSWPLDARRAREATERGRIPDAYRDLVRDYFDRP
jgi:hypothetical protein